MPIENYQIRSSSSCWNIRASEKWEFSTDGKVYWIVRKEKNAKPVFFDDINEAARAWAEIQDE